MPMYTTLAKEKTGDLVELNSAFNAARYKIASVIKYRHLEGVYILVAKFHESLPGLKVGTHSQIIAKIASPKDSMMYPDEWFVWPHVTNRTWQNMLGDEYDEVNNEIGEIPPLLQIHSFESAWRNLMFLHGNKK